MPQVLLEFAAVRAEACAPAPALIVPASDGGLVGGRQAAARPVSDGADAGDAGVVLLVDQRQQHGAAERGAQERRGAHVAQARQQAVDVDLLVRVDDRAGAGGAGGQRGLQRLFQRTGQVGRHGLRAAHVAAVGVGVGLEDPAAFERRGHVCGAITRRVTQVVVFRGGGGAAGDQGGDGQGGVLVDECHFSCLRTRFFQWAESSRAKYPRACHLREQLHVRG